MTRDSINKISILILSGLFFIPFLGGVHLFDWDEINFAEIAREMIVTGDYLRPQINFQPFWEKPPLFIWMQVLSMKIFGINEFAARFPNAVCGMASLLLIYTIGKRYKDEAMGMWWVLAYLGSILPHLYFRSGIIDPWFNLFIFLGIYTYVLSREIFTSRRFFYIGFSGFFIALAVLTKGPVALLIFGLTGLIFGIFTRFRNWLWFSTAIIFLISFTLTMGLWYGIEIMQNGTWFVEEFIRYQIRLFQTKDAGHGGFPGYHVVVLLLGCFPASVFALRALFSYRNAEPSKEALSDFRLMMKILFWVVLIVFSIVSTKIVHYSSLCYFPLTFLAAQELYRLSSEKQQLHWFGKILLGLIGLVFGLAALAFPILLKKKDLLIPYLKKDPFAAETLMAQVSNPFYLYAAGIVILVSVIVGFALSKKENPANGFRVLFIGNAIGIMLVIYLVIGRAEMFSQHAHIEFLKTCAAKNIPVQTFGFKSYAQYFYGQSTQTLPSGETILAEGYPQDICISAKINREAELDARGDLIKLDRKNGFVFYLKKASNVE